jgi:hypothetical protein
MELQIKVAEVVPVVILTIVELHQELMEVQE